ncbi:MAG TPA: hypothetical protein VMU95_05055 [Trebonia sp.]|nr:hypothetical protein [Trebonia sp.]
MAYMVRITIPASLGVGPYRGHAGSDALDYLVEQDKTREWVEEQVAAPRREGRDILFAGQVLSWKHIRAISISKTSPDPSTSPYTRRRGAGPTASAEDVTHEFITGAPGEPGASRPAGRTLTEFSDDQLIEELRRRLHRH